MGEFVFNVEVQESPLVTVVRCSGRLVRGSGVDKLLQAARLSDTRYILIDLRGVKTIDAAGLGALAELERRGRSEGCSIQMVNLSKHVHQMVIKTGLASVLQIFPPAAIPPELEAALRAGDDTMAKGA